MTTRTPIPFVQSPARNGTFQEFFPNTEELRTQGSYKDGLKTGSWKTYSPSGTLESDLEWSRGLQHGHELRWSESGQPRLTGQYIDGTKTGKWTSFYESGAFHEASFYVNGKRQGEYVWDAEDGSPLCRGAFSEECRHGLWTWWDSPYAPKIERTYWQGTFDGDHKQWDKDGFLLQICPYRRGYKHGLEEAFHEKGKPKFRGEWLGGNAVGEHQKWDIDGILTTTAFTDGLEKSVATNTRKINGLVKKLTKAKDGHKKSDLLAEMAGYDGRGALLLKLWREGLYDVPSDPQTWEALLTAAGLMSPDEIIKFLETSVNTGVHGLQLPYWSSILDALVMYAYEDDPAPFDAAWQTLPPLNKKGVAFVMARFGKDVGDTLKDELDILLSKHIDNFGFDTRVLWPVDGRVRQVQLFFEPGHKKTEYFHRFLDLFTTKAAWIEGLRQRAKKDIGNGSTRIAFRQFQELIEAASIQELIGLIDAISLDNFTHTYIQTALTDWRSFSAKEITHIALNLKDTGLRKWPTICLAVLQHHQESNDIPDSLIEAFVLDAESPTFSWDWYYAPLRAVDENLRGLAGYKANYPAFGVGCAVPRSKLIHDALAVMPDAAVLRIFERYMASDFFKSYAAPYAYRLPDTELWQRVIQVLDAESNGHDPRYTWEFAGNIGLPSVPIIEKSLGSVNAKLKGGLSCGIVVALAQAASQGEKIPEAYDKHIDFSKISPDYSGQFLVPFFARLIHLLPTERAEPLLLAGLNSDQFGSAFGMIGSHPTKSVLETAFNRLLDLETTLKWGAKDSLTIAIQSMPNPEEWIRWIFANGGGGGIKDELLQAIGRPAFEKLFAEITQTITPPKELDHIDKLLALTADNTKGDTLYVLRRLDKEPDESSLNRIGGFPPGIGTEAWPLHDEEPMAHLFSLDLKTMPDLEQRYPKARTMSVFCHQPEYNEAWTPDSGWTEVRFVSDADITANPAPHDEAPETEDAAFEVVSLKVP